MIISLKLNDDENDINKLKCSFYDELNDTVSNEGC